MQKPLKGKSINMDNIEIRPSSELQSGDENDLVYEEYGNVYEEYEAIDIEQLNVDVREISDENAIERDDEEYEAYDGNYEPYRPIESRSTYPIITKKKMLTIFLVLGTVGLVIGLCVHFTESPENLQLPIISSTISNMNPTTTIRSMANEFVCDSSGKEMSIHSIFFVGYVNEVYE